jgi:hypothetical protein
MTDDPLARLREELVAAADRRNEARHGIPAPDRRRRRRHRGGWIALGAVLVAAPAGATAAGIITFGKSDESKARTIVVAAMRDTAQLPACKSARSTRTVLTEGLPLQGITATLPSLRRAAAGIDPERVLRRLRVRLPGPVLRRTVRRFVMPGDVEVIAYVQDGGSLRPAADTAGCHAARRERAARLSAGRSRSTRQAVAVELADQFEGATRSQILWVFSQSPPRSPFSGNGAGAPVKPGQRLRTGLLSSGSGRDGRRRYVGIAGARTAAVLLRAQRPGHAGRFPARVAVQDGFYAFELPRGIGPVSLDEVTAGGRVLRTRAVRR